MHDALLGYYTFDVKELCLNCFQIIFHGVLCGVIIQKDTYFYHCWQRWDKNKCIYNKSDQNEEPKKFPDNLSVSFKCILYQIADM